MERDGKISLANILFLWSFPIPSCSPPQTRGFGLILKVSINPHIYIDIIYIIYIVYLLYILYIYYISIIYLLCIYILYLYYICISIYILYLYYICISIYICVYSVYIYIPWRILALPPALAGPALPKPWWWRVHWNKPTWNSISLSPR